MKILTVALTAAALSLTAGLAQARDLSPDETLKLRDAGTIQAVEKLDAAALALHPGGKTEDTELEEEYGRYIYQVEVRDAQGVQWDVELDATNAQVLKNQRDD
ncbi:PepSY domain-containing protein [Pseudomonas sp. EA_35y_Pfl2_R111]|uniref:PepSY domain-containing protein n=1 Tax=Pseudomonas sp. EA_35y_Pfl2_R111 TaxID=3088689 RepID=UPI0030DC4999